MKKEILNKVTATQDYLYRWKRDAKDQVTSNHIFMIISDLHELEGLLKIHFKEQEFNNDVLAKMIRHSYQSQNGVPAEYNDIVNDNFFDLI